jgi:hypothetical protein
MFVLSDRVKQNSISEGFGDVVFQNSFASFQTFSEAIGDGNSTYYTIENYENFEIGIGTYHASTNSLSRDAVLLSSNNNNKINLRDVSNVFCTYPAKAAFLLNQSGYATSLESGYQGIKFPDGTIQRTAATSSNFSRARSYKTISSDYSLFPDDDFILIDTSSGDVHITLPEASSSEGFTITFKKILGNNKCIIYPHLGQSIDSSNSIEIQFLNVSLSTFSNGSNWYIV